MEGIDGDHEAAKRLRSFGIPGYDIVVEDFVRVVGIGWAI